MTWRTHRARWRDRVLADRFSWTRHPMYVGSMLTAMGALLQSFSAWNALVCLAFCACQMVRARLEERKLGGLIPEYGRYAATVGWLGPFGRRRSGR